MRVRVRRGMPRLYVQVFARPEILAALPDDNSISVNKWAGVEFLNADHLRQFSYGVSAFLQRSLLFGGEFDLDDLFQALGSELARHADEEVLDPIFALKVDGARQDLLLVLENGLHHFRGRGRRRVVGAAGLEV